MEQIPNGETARVSQKFGEYDGTETNIRRLAPASSVPLYNFVWAQDYPF